MILCGGLAVSCVGRPSELTAMKSTVFSVVALLQASDWAVAQSGLGFQEWVENGGLTTARRGRALQSVSRERAAARRPCC